MIEVVSQHVPEISGGQNEGHHSTFKFQRVKSSVECDSIASSWARSKKHTSGSVTAYSAIIYCSLCWGDEYNNIKCK